MAESSEPASSEPNPPEGYPWSFAEGLFTDLYELTMAQAYHAAGMAQPAVFELFFRGLPETRNFALAAGLNDVLDYLEHMRFAEADLAYLARQGTFSDAFLDRLRDFRFRGDVHAMPEGTVVFPGEPVLRVTAPIFEAQIVETYLLNQVHLQTLAASKAARVVLAAGDRPVVDFGSRRSHGIDAALKVARATYLVGGAGTSNVLAGRRYGIPLFGTMAHSYIQAHDDEAAAFEHYVRLYPGTTLLVDTYDTLGGVRKVIDLASRMGDDFNIHAIRLDSGDPADLSRQARAMLDDAGLTDVKIIVSSGLDETVIAQLLDANAPIDGFGVGTKLAVSRDAPHLDFAYKLVQYADQPRTKLSSHKIIHPGAKQVHRRTESDTMVEDTLTAADDTAAGEALLQPVMRAGERLEAGRVSLQAAREHALTNLDQLPEPLRRPTAPAEPYPVRISLGLQSLLDQQRRAHAP